MQVVPNAIHLFVAGGFPTTSEEAIDVSEEYGGGESGGRGGIETLPKPIRRRVAYVS